MDQPPASITHPFRKKWLLNILNLRTLFTNSHMVKEEILRYYQVDSKKIEVIHNGVEWQEMEKDFQEWTTLRKKQLDTHHLHSERFQFLFVGHNYQRKGLAPLLKGLSLLKEKEWDLSVRWTRAAPGLFSKAGH